MYHGCGSVILATFWASENGYSGPFDSSNVIDETSSSKRRMPTSSWSMMNSSPGSPWRPRRAASSDSGWSGPTDAVPTSTGVPSALWASTSEASALTVVIDACTSSPSTTIVWKWQLRQPRSNQATPQRATASGSNWLKWVGPSIGAPASPSDAAVSPSWTLAWPS